MSNVLQIDKVDQQHLSKKGNFVASLCPYWLKKTFFGGSILWNGVVLFAEHQAKPNSWDMHRHYHFHFLVMDGIVEGWMEFSSGSVWRVAVVQSGEDLANLIRTHWHDHTDHHHHHCHHQQVTCKAMDNFAKVISIQVRTFFCESTFLAKFYKYMCWTNFRASERKRQLSTERFWQLLPSAGGGGKWLLLIGI